MRMTSFPSKQTSLSCKTLLITVLLCWTSVTIPLAFGQEECNQCFFTTNDADDCVVYGKIDGSLLEYPLASQACLDAYQIKIAVIDPFSVGCDPINVNTFVNNGVNNGVLPNSVLAGLGVAEGGFFVELNGVNVLQDTITVDGTTYDCKASASDCYNAMKVYFGNDAAGMSEVEQVCGTILAKLFLNKELEQSLLRERLCFELDDNMALDSACDTVAVSVQATRTSQPDLSCANFAFGTANSTVPGCEGKGPSLGGGTGTSAGPMVQVPYSLVVAAVVAVSVI